MSNNGIINEINVTNKFVTINNPKFKTRDGVIVTHQSYQGGTFTNRNDHNIQFSLKWCPEFITICVIVLDDKHSVHGQSDWCGDALQVVFTDENKTKILLELSMSLYGKNPEYNLDSLFHHWVNFRKDRYYKEGVVLLVQTSQSNENNTLINLININRKGNKTIYNLKIPYNFIQSSPFKKEQQLGFSLLVNDGDQLSTSKEEIEIISLMNNSSSAVIKNDKLMQKYPLSIAMKVSNTNAKAKIFKKGNFEIYIKNNILQIKNDIIQEDIIIESNNFILVINIKKNQKTQLVYISLDHNTNLILNIYKIIEINKIDLSSNCSDIVLNKSVRDLKIFNRILNKGTTASWNTHNEEPDRLIGQRGWSGWFPTTLLYPQNPSEAGILNLTSICSVKNIIVLNTHKLNFSINNNSYPQKLIKNAFFIIDRYDKRGNLWGSFYLKYSKNEKLYKTSFTGITKHDGTIVIVEESQENSLNNRFGFFELVHKYKNEYYVYYYGLKGGVTCRTIGKKNKYKYKNNLYES